jgi:signal transduction histidine kinase
MGQQEGNETHLKGPLSVRFLTMAVVVTVIALSWLGWNTYSTYRHTRESRELAFKIEELRGVITRLDEVLTMSARMAAVTGNPKWENRYHHFEPLLDAAIKESVRLAPGAYSGEAAAQTDAANAELVEMEHRAFDLVRDGHLPQAQQLLASEAYEQQKRLYSDGMDQFAIELGERARAALRSYGRWALIRIVAVLSAIPVLLVTWGAVLLTLRDWHGSMVAKNRQLTAQSHALIELNKHLDEKVLERTRELLYANTHLEAEIADRRQAEETLARHVQELARSNEELERYAYVASHDLQEPLRMVASYVQLLEHSHKDKLDDDAKECIGYAVDGAKRMQFLINDLLAYSRVASHGRPLAPTNSQAVLDQVLTNLNLALEESDVVITQDPLPTVMADPVQLGQVFQNLIGNAIKFRRDRRPEIHIGAKHNDGHWVFSVRDDGIGIDPKYADRIFVIFQRLHAKEEYPGTGIGLAICKRIVERHGGRIWVESEPGNGATFFFTIPDRGGNAA